MADHTPTADKPAKTPHAPREDGPVHDSASSASSSKPAKQTTVEMVKETASTLVNEATGAARSAANSGKDKASEALDGLSKAVETAAGMFEDAAGPTYGNYARKASTAVSDLAENIRSKDIDALIGDTRDFIRNQPMVAIGAAVAVGFALTRLAKLGGGSSDSNDNA